MKPQSKVLVATGAMGLALYGGADYLIERLGYVSSIALLLPQSWLNSMKTEPYLLIGCAVLLAIAIGLLWSVAWGVAKQEKTSRKSNDRAWAFDAEFQAMRDKYDEMLRELAAIRELLTANNEKLDRLETERERTAEEIKASNTQALTATMQQTIGSVRAQLLSEREQFRDDLRNEINQVHSELIDLRVLQEQALTHQQLQDAVAEMSNGLRADAEHAAANMVQTDQFHLDSRIKALLQRVEDLEGTIAQRMQQ